MEVCEVGHAQVCMLLLPRAGFSPRPRAGLWPSASLHQEHTLTCYVPRHADGLRLTLGGREQVIGVLDARHSEDARTPDDAEPEAMAEATSNMDCSCDVLASPEEGTSGL